MAASAIEEPVTPLISVESAIEVWARLPACVRSAPSRAEELQMPELLRKLPARMKSGTGKQRKFCVSVTVSWIGMVAGSSGCCRKKSAPEMPIAKATGIPIEEHREGDEDDTWRAPEHVDRLGLRGLPRSSARTFSAVDKEQHRPDRQAHGHPGVADPRNALEAADAADPGENIIGEIDEEGRDQRVVNMQAKARSGRRFVTTSIDMRLLRRQAMSAQRKHAQAKLAVAASPDQLIGWPSIRTPPRKIRTTIRTRNVAAISPSAAQIAS